MLSLASSRLIRRSLTARIPYWSTLREHRSLVTISPDEMVRPEDIPTSLAQGELYLLPQTSQGWPGSGENLQITVLDSSFNPPHRGHLGLATLRQEPKRSPSHSTANLLLFSLTNVEKTPSPSDPSLSQRLHLISLLLPYLPPNTAVGLLNDPTFAGKSKTIHNHLALSPKPELRFVMGADTLTRFFAPRYYVNTPGGMPAAMKTFFEDEGCTLISARRGGEEERRIEEELMGREEIRDLVERGKIILAGTGKEESVDFSSTKVRAAVKANEWDKVEKLVVPEIVQYIKEEGLYNS